MMNAANLDEWKKAAARVAADLVVEGMVIGLGTGSTAAHLVSFLGERVRRGLKIVAIPTSERTRGHALAEGIPITDFSTRIDLTLDGADEIARRSLDLIKGGGGALLREKIVASASDRMVVIADASKLVDRLGETFALPVEIAPFGWEVTLARLAGRFREARLRRAADGAAFITDGGHYIVDCGMEPTRDPAALERELNAIVGVMETGLFVGVAREALIGGADGVIRLTPD